MELFTKLGIDGRLILAQIANFAILLWLLQRFVYRPIITMLDKRRVRIAKSLEEAARIDEESKRLAVLKEEKVNEAKAEAAEVLKGARERAEEMEQEGMRRAKEKADAVIAKARDQLRHEQREAMQAVRVQAAEAVARATAAVLGERMTHDDERHFIDTALEKAVKTMK